MPHSWWRGGVNEKCVTCVDPAAADTPDAKTRADSKQASAHPPRKIRFRRLLKPFIPPPSCLLLLWFAWCGRRGRGQPAQFAAEDDEQRLLLRERHPVCTPGVALDFSGEAVVVVGAGFESAVAGERLVHDFLAGEARNARLDRGKMWGRP